jgi:hypothetical protein
MKTGGIFSLFAILVVIVGYTAGCATGEGIEYGRAH